MVNRRRLLRGSYSNIIDIYEKAPDDLKLEGASWYTDASIIAQNVGNVLLDNAFNITDEPQARLLGAGILACFSPQMVWEKNIRAANVFARDTHTKPVWITDRDYNKALGMVKGFTFGVLSLKFILEQLGEGAVKTRPFFMNIHNPIGTAENNGVTIDRHAIAIYLNKIPNALQVGRATRTEGNKQIQNSYKIASNKLGVHHNTVQATTWLEWRISKGK